MLVLTNPLTGKWQTYGYQAFAGAGMGMGSWVVQVGVQAAVSRKDVGALLALYATFGSFGGFLGDAFASYVFTPHLTEHLRELLPNNINNEGWIRAIRESIVVAKSFDRGSLERAAIDESWTLTMRMLHTWSAGALALACFVVWGMKNLSLDDDNDDDTLDEDESNKSSENSPLLAGS